MNILGIHGGVTIGQHDVGAALLADGKLAAVCEEERLIRIKSAKGTLPIRSIAACLGEAKLTMQDIDLVVHPGETYDDMPARIAHYFRHYFGHVPKIEMINHQLAHLASAYYCSNFTSAALMSYDAFGDQLSAALAIGEAGEIRILETRDGDNSVGDFFGMITQFLGFEAGSDEYKIMGLAPYGRPGIDLSPILWPTDDGYATDRKFWRNDPPPRSYLEPRYSSAMRDLLGEPRHFGAPLTQYHKDIAYAAQQAVESCAVALITHLHKITGQTNVCLAGGVALNCVANHRISQLPFVENLFVQPAASDRGLALGCALYGAARAGEACRGLEHVFLGRTCTLRDMEDAMNLTGTSYTTCDDVSGTAAELLANGYIVGWFEGRSEFGPRALGHRSIIADPRSAAMKDKVNACIKYREEFRPFAPAVIIERAAELFELVEPLPFMTITKPVHEQWQSKLGGVTHVDGTARVQTVSQDVLPRYHAAIQRFGEITGVPAVMNTSFNIKGEPIVETPLDALGTFGRSGLDVLFLGPYLVRKGHVSL